MELKKTTVMLLLILFCSVMLQAEGKQDAKVYGEFQDQEMYNASLEGNPAMKDWTDKQLFDGLSGATMQLKTFGIDLPPCMVLLGDEILGYADGFGQFWISLAPGTYTLTGRCEGYKEVEIELKVKAGEKYYINFIMPEAVEE